jgi:phage-related minor tail protein
MPEPIDTWTVAIDADLSELEQQLTDAARLGAKFSNTLSQAFVDVSLKGRGLGDVLRSLTLSLSQMALKAAFKPLTDSLGTALAGAVAGAFANGGVIRSGLPVPFASGGVIAAPTLFPLANGRIGLAGERGAEAIMPLARGPDGRLGVAATGGSGLSVTFNVTAADAESFRRSETQIAAMLARAVGYGQRNL